MRFLHPEFLWLAPIVALPIIIHLLNRLRYRRVRWAAIEFLLSSERRAVRRARLRQILLMILRTLVLAAALGALVQPVISGGIARLLGGSSQVVIVIDASASMRATRPSGSSFDRARTAAARLVRTLPHGTRATVVTLTTRAEPSFPQPISDVEAVASVIEAAQVTSGPADLPAGLRAAAEVLERGGGGGVIWLFTDLQAAGWRAGESGAWEAVRLALEKAGNPRVVISTFKPASAWNRCVSSVQVSPVIMVEGDTPTLTATVESFGQDSASAELSLLLNGKRIGSRTMKFDGPAKVDGVFTLPPIKKGVHAGMLQLSSDALPADDRHYFLLRTTEQIPVLIIDGAPSDVPFQGAADFLALALEPPPSELGARSILKPETVPPAQLSSLPLQDYAAIFLADVSRLDREMENRLTAYVEHGGLLVVFPGAHADIAAWNRLACTGATFASNLNAPEDEPFKIEWLSPTHPLTASLPNEGIDKIKILRMFKMTAKVKDNVLATAAGGNPLLIQAQAGRGKALTFAVSCQSDFSNFPLTGVFVLTLHRAVRSHLVEAAEPLARTAFAELSVALPTGAHKIATPDGRLLPLTPMEDAPQHALFNHTAHAGLYRLVKDESPAPEATTGVLVAAINPPAEESSLELTHPEAAASLLQGVQVSFLSADEKMKSLSASRGEPSAASTFPLALLALLCLLGGVILAWSMGRTWSRNGPGQAEAR